MNNNKKTNTLLTVEKVATTFTKTLAKIEKVKKVNVCNQSNGMYTGFTNFSVNIKKTKYTIYCDNALFNALHEKYNNDNITYVANRKTTNSTDEKHRNNIIELTDNKLLTDMIVTVCELV